MPQKSKYKLKKQAVSNEPLNERLARLRKQKGYTQIELSEKVGITQALISAYERGRLRPNHEVIIGLALALEVTTDELLGVKEANSSVTKPSLKILRRMNKIEQLPPSQQRALLQTIDNFLKGVAAQQ